MAYQAKRPYEKERDKHPMPCHDCSRVTTNWVWFLHRVWCARCLNKDNAPVENYCKGRSVADALGTGESWETR